MRLSDLPSRYTEHRVSDACPSNSLLPDFIPQLQPHLMLAGKEALFKVQLTQVQDGSVLGFSFSHGMSGEQAWKCTGKWHRPVQEVASNALSDFEMSEDHDHVAMTMSRR